MGPQSLIMPLIELSSVRNMRRAVGALRETGTRQKISEKLAYEDGIHELDDNEA